MSCGKMKVKARFSVGRVFDLTLNKSGVAPVGHELILCRQMGEGGRRMEGVD